MAATDPLMIDMPPLLHSKRLVPRPPCAGDGAALSAAAAQSIDELKPWLPWARKVPTRAEAELTCRQMAARFAQRTDLPLLIFARRRDGGCGRLLGEPAATGQGNARRGENTSTASVTMPSMPRSIS